VASVSETAYATKKQSRRLSPSRLKSLRVCLILYSTAYPVCVTLIRRLEFTDSTRLTCAGWGGGVLWIISLLQDAMDVHRGSTQFVACEPNGKAPASTGEARLLERPSQEVISLSRHVSTSASLQYWESARGSVYVPVKTRDLYKPSRARPLRRGRGRAPRRCPSRRIPRHTGRPPTKSQHPPLNCPCT
jgi:hypothetical protein